MELGVDNGRSLSGLVKWDDVVFVKGKVKYLVLDDSRVLVFGVFFILLYG